ncbi:MAG: glycoside hydrolase family 127 protein [Bacteroidales bacterium]|nr:glycoside hydrolase family 127 protein [Bacteroidales bacterium]MBN2818571.1 glycoside hydrolase family 127 protein [Bacteroidales bacterium]
MKKILILFFVFGLLTNCKESVERYTYPRKAVNLNFVELTDSFWLPKIKTIQNTTIKYAFDKITEEGRLDNFLIAGGKLKGKTRGKMPFDDTDVYKIIEGASYSIISSPDPILEAYIDSVINIIATGQEDDGYLTTWKTIDPMNPPAWWVEPGGRWENLSASHELYNSGHLFEAASAHYYATGKQNFLNIALKNADLLVQVFGDTSNHKVPGHQIVETGLIKLFEITKKDDYLRLSKKFLDSRGDSTHRELFGSYSQDSLPVIQQSEVVGHAVRAVYMYAAMTDIAAILNDTAYYNATMSLWNNMVNKKMYITGGLGARHNGEAFGENYELPNLTAYSETCAAIGSVYWNLRLFLLTGDSKYYDVLERTLYNGVIPGISLDGDEFFYPNALESDGKYAFNHGSCTRESWFDCSCCPTNLIRFIPYIPNLIYSTSGKNIYVNLYMSNKANIKIENSTIQLIQTTDYPWNGKIKIEVIPEKETEFNLKIRIPGWVQNHVVPGDLYSYNDNVSPEYKVLLNNKEILNEPESGYITIRRKWLDGDIVEINFPMTPRKVITNNKVKTNEGLTAIELGPVVYCAEEIDNNSNFDEIKISNQSLFSVHRNFDLLSGINIIYATDRIKQDSIKLIPYYAWSNRGVNKMKIWIPNELNE